MRRREGCTDNGRHFGEIQQLRLGHITARRAELTDPRRHIASFATMMKNFDGHHLPAGSRPPKAATCRPCAISPVTSPKTSTP